MVVVGLLEVKLQGTPVAWLYPAVEEQPAGRTGAEFGPLTVTDKVTQLPALEQTFKRDVPAPKAYRVRILVLKVDWRILLLFERTLYGIAPPEIVMLAVWPIERLTLSWLKTSRPPLAPESELTVTVKDPQLLEETQILKVEEPLAIPRSVKVLPDRLACTTFGFEFEAT